MKKYTFGVKNFGSINTAEIELNKINIVAGINGSGKSTASKVLYSFLLSISQEGNDYLNYEWSKDLINIKKSISKFRNENNEIKELYDKFTIYHTQLIHNDFNEDEFLNFICTLNELNKNEFKSPKLEKSINDFEKELLANKNFKNRIKEILKLAFHDEFDGEVPFTKETSLSLDYNNDKSNFSLKIYSKKELVEYNGLDFSIDDVFYIETPFIFDFFRKSDFNEIINNNSFLYHQRSLIKNLHEKTNYDTLTNNDEANEILNNMINGTVDFSVELKSFRYNSNNYSSLADVMDGTNYNIKNTASGIKTIAILQKLIKSNLGSNSFIIMDEPEVHLHPEWQLKLAESIVILTKFQGINFYINSHSPQFIEAIEVYSKKYSLENETNFYLSRLNEKNTYNFEKVSRDNLEILYKNLGNIFNTLDKIRAENLSKEF